MALRIAVLLRDVIAPVPLVVRTPDAASPMDHPTRFDSSLFNATYGVNPYKTRWLSLCHED